MEEHRNNTVPLCVHLGRISADFHLIIQEHCTGCRLLEEGSEISERFCLALFLEELADLLTGTRASTAQVPVKGG